MHFISGVVLTLPEHRLSFQLKVYESIVKREREQRQLLDMHKWLESNVRSILDESDAILHPKYQLIYTVGNQIPIDGGSQRWIVLQELLKRVPYHMRQLYLAHGDKCIEFNNDYVKRRNVHSQQINYRNDVFVPCRILDDSMFPLLKQALIEDFLNGKISFTEITASAKHKLRHILSEKEINKQTIESTLEQFGDTEKNTVYILSGMLRFEVLKSILTKRWRVNYGVSVNGHRKMAIPFKAKDVAAEKTEFGHSDVAICLTQLSYYYSGSYYLFLCSFQDKNKRCNV